MVAQVIHIPLSRVGMYAERTMPKEQYVATVKYSYEAFEEELSDAGFIRNFPSSLKSRKYDMPPEIQVSTWAWFPNGLLRSEWMLDLELFVGEDEETVDVYAHWEPSWLRHPIRHYRANEVDAEKGVELTLDKLDEMDVSHVLCEASERYSGDVDECRYR